MAKFFKSRVWRKVPEESTLIIIIIIIIIKGIYIAQVRKGHKCAINMLKVPEFPYNTVQDRWKEAPTPKTSPIRSTVSIEH